MTARSIRRWGRWYWWRPNIVCINLSGVTTFLLQGVRPRTWWEEERARTATRIAIAGAVVMLLALTAILAMTDLFDSLD